jgi:two-component system OmpR family response regulator
MDTILIVDDSSYIVDGLIAFLKKQYRTLAAYGGAECLEILKRETPSVIILDIMMEPIDGWETLARIKEDPKTRHIPVLMFSAKKISRKEAEEHRINIDDFIIKPVSPKKIIEAIEKVLARRDANQIIVERWQTAGISREKIDEFLSLVTNLEVDLSLCQNIRIQYDLVHPQDKNQGEFQDVITAIEGRIQEERDQIESLTREMNRLLETAEGSGREGVPGTGSRSLSPVPAGSGEDHSDCRTPEVLPVVPPSELRIIPIPSLSLDVPSDELPGLSLGKKHQAQESKDTTPPPPGGSLQKAGELQGIAFRGPPAGTGESSGQTGTVPEGREPGEGAAGESGVSYPEPVQPVSMLMIHQPLEDEPHPGGPDTIPRDEIVPQYRPLVPADPDAFRVSQNEVPTGAGTDAPMPWARSREGKITVEQPAVRPEPSGPVSRAPQGFVTRIIALVTGFFRKK